MSLIGTLGNWGARAGAIAPFAISASMTFGACTTRPGWESSISPNFPAGTPPAVNEVRIPINDRFTLVDDGDGIFRSTGKPERDRWERINGQRLQDSDPALQNFLGSMSLDSVTIRGMRVTALQTYARKAPALLDAFANSLDEEASWSSYQEVVRAVEGACAHSEGNSASRVTTITTRSISIAGASGCFIPFHLARTASAGGDLEAMNRSLQEAGDCIKLFHTPSPPSAKEIRLDGYRTAIMAAIAKCEADGDALAMVNRLLALGKGADRDNVVDQALFKETATRATAALRASVRIAAASAEVKADIGAGNVVRLEARLAIIRSAAELTNLGSTIVDDLKRARTAGYLEALESLRALAADASRTKETKEKLDDLEKRGRDLNGPVRKEIQEIRAILRRSSKK